MDDPLPYTILFIFFTLLAAIIELSSKAVLYQNHLNIKKIFSEEDTKVNKLIAVIDNSTKMEQMADSAVNSCLIFATCFSSPYFVGQVASLSAFSRWPLLVTYIVSVTIVFCATAFLLFTFAKCLPGKIGMKHSDSLCLKLLSCLKFFVAVFSPIYYVSDALSGIFARLAGAKPEDVVEDVTEGEIRQMIDEGRENGNIEESETDMIHGIFEFDDRLVSEILTHRTEVTAVELESSLEEIIEVIYEKGFSRIPVYKDSLDDVVGILYVKDLLPLISKADTHFALADHLREALFVPETNSLKELFEKFKSTHIQMAVVLDEYGGTLGIVTMEDLIESIMGSIRDEYDDDAEADEDDGISLITENEYLVSGLCTIKDVEEKLDISVRNEDDCETIGGLAVSVIGMIPGEDEQPELQIDNIHIKIMSMIEHRVDKLILTVIPEVNEDDEVADDAESGFAN